MLQVTNIEKYYGSRNQVTKALNRVSFRVEDGEFLAIMGASGSGKTTLLNCISTIDTVSAGEILLDGVNVANLSETELAGFRREKLGFVFQDYNLLDTLTVEENIGLALSLNHINPGAVRTKVEEMAAKLGIADILDKFPCQISGGQKQRTACARAMVAGQSLILADEPTGSVKLVQHYPKIIPVTFPALSTFISSMADRQRVRFSSRDRVSYITLKSAVKYFLTAAKSGGASCAGSGSCPSAAVYIS